MISESCRSCKNQLLDNTVAVVLGAGKGTRMKSDLPKVLHCINGIPMIKRVVNSIRNSGIEKIFVVVGYKGNLVREKLSGEKIEFVEQKEQLGTAHAVLQTEEKLKNYKGDIFVINGDSPLIKIETMKKIIEEHKLHKPAVTILTSLVEEPYGYGRVIRLNDNKIDKIIEEKEADEKEKKIKEVNVGVYCFSSECFFSCVREVKMNNKKGEMYITDLIKIFRNKNMDVRGVLTKDTNEVIGVDTQEKLLEAESILMNGKKG